MYEASIKQATVIHVGVEKPKLANTMTVKTGNIKLRL